MPKPYYEEEGVRIYHGDALEILPGIPPLSAGGVVLDPPYSMQPNAVRGRDDGAAGASGSPVRLLTETLGHTRRILRAGGIAALVCDWRRLPDVSYLATLRGLRIATCVAWTRTTPGTGGLLRSAWDPVLVLSSGTPTAKNRAAVPNTVAADHPRKRRHPYEKPPRLWAHILHRIPAATILDPFAGVGSSMVAALQTGHRWIV